MADLRDYESVRPHLPRKPGPLTGAAHRNARPQSLRGAARKIKTEKLRRAQPAAWQDEAWSLHDLLGEVSFATTLTGNTASRARIFAARLRDDADEPEPIDLSSEDLTPVERTAAEAVHRFGGGPSGRAELIGRHAAQLFVAGDGFLVGLPPEGRSRAEIASNGDGGLPPSGGDVDVSELVWSARATSEVRVRGGKVQIADGPDVNSGREYEPDEVVIVRSWRPHPRHWWTAHSPMRSNLPILRELLGLTKHVAATIDSRLAGNGLLILARELVEAYETDAEPAEGGDTPSFVDDLIDVAQTAIQDRESASALVPLVVTTPSSALKPSEAAHWLSFRDSFDEHAVTLREEAIRRFALGIDMPPEILLGLGDTNHWSAWQIEEAAVKTQTDPLMALICDSATTDYLWPILSDVHGEDDASNIVVWFSTDELTLRPNRGTDAQDLYDRGELSGKALRRERGFDETDAPQQDRALDLALKLVEAAPSLFGDPGLDAIVESIRRQLEQSEPDEEGDGVTPPDAEGEGTGDRTVGEDRTLPEPADA